MAMKEVHEIVRDREQLERFVEWLPDLKPNERYFLCLQARKKYMPELKSSDKTQLKRFTSTKEMLITKIQQLECPVGCYTTKEGATIPDKGIALYITLNPRDMMKATQSGAKGLIDMMAKQFTGTGQKDFNPHSEVLSYIHKSKGSTGYVHFDIDRPTGDEQDENAPKSVLTTQEVYDKAVEIVGEEAVTVIETRGGCHLMVSPSKVVSETKNWYPVITKNIQCDQSGDLMVPVVGCNQGGFTPYFYK